MSFATTWSEELVAEWLAIKGYLVKTNMPIGAGKGGGRREADVVGVKVENDKVHIVHAEVASLAEGPSKIIPRYRNKFNWGQTGIENYFKEKWNIKGRIVFEKVIVGTWVSENVRKAIEKELPDVKLFTFKTLIEKEISPIVDKYVEENKVFPTNFWLLNLLLYLKHAKKKHIKAKSE